MSTTGTHPLVEGYLDRLERGLRDLPGARRREIVDEIREHLVEALAASGAATSDSREVEIRTALDRLGDPEDIAADARERFGVQREPARWQEITALILLPLGGFLFLVGWFVGVVLLWTSPRWTVRDKVIGTAFVPGGLFAVVVPGFLLEATSSVPVCSSSDGGPTTCSGGPPGWNQGVSTALVILLLLAPIASVIYLALRLRRSRANV